MKQPKKPTYNQKKLMSKYDLNPTAWAVVSEDKSTLEIIDKETGKRKVIFKD